MTNVKPSELNYDKYTTDKYDQDIINSIPFHKELHRHIADFVVKNFDSAKEYEILDLGTGTGITAKLLQDLLPKAKIDAVDFSEQMIAGAKKKLDDKNTHYLLGDYSKMSFDKQYDIVVSVIGLHHQNTEGKQKMFGKIHSLLKQSGVFIFGDLMTYADKYEAARNHALHYHHLVEHAADEMTLTEWAHHHMFLNDLASIEDQTEWLTRIGFKVQKDFSKMNTALLLCIKN
ncbi:MAG: class I SAM-dependent methyltransferase [Patescibacteria group bacterium]